MSLFEKSHSAETGNSYDSADASTGPSCAADASAVPGEAFASGNSLYARLQRAAGRLGVEQRGIERVPEEDKTDTSMSHAGTLVSRARPPAVGPLLTKVLTRLPQRPPAQTPREKVYINASALGSGSQLTWWSRHLPSASWRSPCSGWTSWRARS